MGMITAYPMNMKLFQGVTNVLIKIAVTKKGKSMEALRIREALADYYLRTGKIMRQQKLAEHLWPNSSKEVRHVNMSRLIHGKTRQMETTVVEIICDVTGVDANFLYGIPTAVHHEIVVKAVAYLNYLSTIEQAKKWLNNNPAEELREAIERNTGCKLYHSRDTCIRFNRLGENACYDCEFNPKLLR